MAKVNKFKDGEVVVIWRKLSSDYLSLWLVFREGTNWRYRPTLGQWLNDAEPLLLNPMRAEHLLSAVSDATAETLEDAIENCTDARYRKQLLESI